MLKLGPIKLAEIKNLAPLPLSVVRLAELVSDPGSGTQDFAAVIKYDPALTADVLRWANSSWSQTRTPIADVGSAVTRVGSENILKLAFGYHLMAPMKKANTGYQLSENALWRHSVAAAMAAEKIKKLAVGLSIPSSVFTAALMHDLGKIVLGRNLGVETLRDAILKKTEEGATYIEAEREITGTDHAEVGAAMAEIWKIPEVLVTAIACHHDLDSSPGMVSDVVQVANTIAKLLGEGLGTEQLNMRVNQAAAERLRLNESGIQRICLEVREELQQTETQWEMN